MNNCNARKVKAGENSHSSLALVGKCSHISMGDNATVSLDSLRSYDAICCRFVAQFKEELTKVLASTSNPNLTSYSAYCQTMERLAVDPQFAEVILNDREKKKRLQPFFVSLGTHLLLKIRSEHEREMRSEHNHSPDHDLTGFPSNAVALAAVFSKHNFERDEVLADPKDRILSETSIRDAMVTRQLSSFTNDLLVNA